MKQEPGPRTTYLQFQLPQLLIQQCCILHNGEVAETPREAVSVETAEQGRTTGRRCARAVVKVPRNVPLKWVTL